MISSMEGWKTALKNILTIDLEDWYQSILSISPFDWGRYEKRIWQGTNRLLEIMAKTGAKATFFILGKVASEHGELVRLIASQGHEIGSHGYCHRPVYEQTKAVFSKDLERSIKILEDITGKKVKGYRAPWFSITKKTLWALDILSAHGIEYDASIFPFQTGFYGISKAPRHPYKIKTKHKTIIEIPPSTLKLCKAVIPIGGGFYLRMLPCNLIRYGIRRLNRKNIPAVIYIHPWELDLKQPRLSPGFIQGIIHYTNIEKAEFKLSKLLSDFRFGPVKDALPLLTGIR